MEDRPGSAEWDERIANDAYAQGYQFSYARYNLWRPIASAPKDGTYILGNKYFLDAGWSPRVMRWERGEWLTDPGDQHQEPTLWVPLPAPPIE